MLMKKYWYPCEHCLTYFPSQLVLTQHEFNCQTLKCNFCVQTFIGDVSKAHIYHRYSQHAISKHFEAIFNLWIHCEVCGLWLPPEDPDVLLKHKAASMCSQCSRHEIDLEVTQDDVDLDDLDKSLPWLF